MVQREELLALHHFTAKQLQLQFKKKKKKVTRQLTVLARTVSTHMKCFVQDSYIKLKHWMPLLYSDWQCFRNNVMQWWSIAQNDSNYPHEVAFNVGIGHVEQLQTAVQVSEGPDAEAAGGMELRLQELAASVAHRGELQDIGCRKDSLQEEGCSV